MGSTIKGSHQSDFLDLLSGDRRLSLRGPVFMAPPWVVGFMISSGVKLLARHAQLPAPSFQLPSRISTDPDPDPHLCLPGPETNEWTAINEPLNESSRQERQNNYKADHHHQWS